jgi:tyrosyl-DNA phosphodiesterase 1
MSCRDDGLDVDAEAAAETTLADEGKNRDDASSSFLKRSAAAASTASEENDEPPPRKRPRQMANQDSNIDHNMVPIKLFRSRQMEEQLQSSSLSSSNPSLLRASTTTLRELLRLDDEEQRSIRWLIISNYLVDFALLLDEIPELVSIPLVVCFYGSAMDDKALRLLQRACCTRFHAIRLNPSDPPRSAGNPLHQRVSSRGALLFSFPHTIPAHSPPSQIPFGVHHSKFFLIGYDDDSLRLVIHTALHLKTDAAYIQDFARKKKKRKDMTTTTTRQEQDDDDLLDDDDDYVGHCPFERDLIDYLRSYRYNVRHNWDNGPSSSSNNSSNNNKNKTALTMTQLVAQFDFSTARAVLLPSVPGYHLADHDVMHRYGHLKLRQAVRRCCCPATTNSKTSASAVTPSLSSKSSTTNNKNNNNAAVVCQFSSMGSLNEKWLLGEFGASTTGAAMPTTTMSGHGSTTTRPQPRLLLVYPTAEEVRSSVEGYAGGGSLPADTKNVTKAFLQPLYHRWSSSSSEVWENPFALGRNLPHIKTFYRYDNDSDNDTIGGMQWFVLTSHNISSAAWGQLQKKNRQLFVRHWELGVFLSPQTLGCRRLVPYSSSLSSSHRPTSNGAALSSSTGENDDDDDDIATVPLPYLFHPEPYQPGNDGDEPWAWDNVFTKSDAWGRRGLNIGSHR